ncbi:DUF983 domain-containing protein [Roseomonas xinghualingensis]|uniref:DUF983 domain-containing protein n=1 Tax=Roseomonas xinghualingensis TaxID=2986475 RepID=UPI0021F1C467|nr:DUF983 domain-containing protein [Roseomonas sp. SXEYE001]MCV4208123.1 DUF983 domain-containing protein [Roseomonas sp. SXEYE001]
MPNQPGVPPPETIWRPASARLAEAGEQPSMLTMVRRGFMNRCPICNQGRVFRSFLGVVPECEACHAPLGVLRADDAPPYIVIFLAGHVLVPPIFWIERAYEPPMWLHMAVWLPLFAVVCTLLLRPVKGGVVGWMMRLGFADHDRPDERPPALSGTSRDD